jgi:hypothetical protein
VSAEITLFEVAAQGSRPADRNIAESFPLLWGDGVSPLFQKLFSMPTEDSGYLEPMLVHRLLPSPSDTSSSRNSRLSMGLGVDWSFCSET